jgi:hypothetical protein
VSIGSRSKISLEIIRAVLNLIESEMEESNDSPKISDYYTEAIAHAGRALSQLFEIDIPWLESLDPLSRWTEFQHRLLSALDRCDDESVTQAVKLFFNTSTEI